MKGWLRLWLFTNFVELSINICNSNPFKMTMNGYFSKKFSSESYITFSTVAFMLPVLKNLSILGRLDCQQIQHWKVLFLGAVATINLKLVVIMISTIELMLLYYNSY